MIRVHELTKRFVSGKRTVLAVDRLSFQVSEGEVYGLLGPNGAGKTTTLRMILGLLQPTAGYAEISGMRTSEEPDAVKAKIGFVSASAGLYQSLSPREMLLLFADLYGLNDQAAHTSLAQLTELLDLGRFIDQRCGTLSTGQRQRVTLARALIHDPPIMLLDEPTRGLDIVGSKVVFDYVAHLRKRGKAVIISTHRLDEAQRLGDRFGLLHHGHLEYEGSLAELQQATQRESLVEMFLQRIETTGDSKAAIGDAREELS